MNATSKLDVLICGAGPTGLVLALRLARSGVRFRIVDASPEPGTTSRALVVHARTLEFYRQMGLVDAFLDEGLPFEALNLWVGGRRVAHADITELGEGVTRFPTMMVCTQDRHERFLVEQLRRAGVEVERATKLLDFRQDPGGVAARIQHADGREETCRASYLAGCDGAHSRVREVLGVGFPGGTYSRMFYVADVEARGPVMNGELHVALDDAEFMGIFPLRGGTTARLIGSIVADERHTPESMRWDDVHGDIAKRLGIEVERVNWFSTYRVHHRVANTFRDRRVFLLGDAAHIHSPVGGQGMNTGIGDAMNLAWRLADVAHGRAPASVLDGFAPERRAFARKLVGTTDRAFTLVTSPGRIARFVRTRVVPRIVPMLFRRESFRRLMFRTISQTAITYRDVAPGAGAPGGVRVGDRLPWVALERRPGPSDNFAVLDDRTWQVHVYGEPEDDLAGACARLDLPLHVFPWEPAMGTAGLTRNALYLVRPDGHVALARSVEALPGEAAQYLAIARSTLSAHASTPPART